MARRNSAGYFVSGFSGMQFALPTAAEKIEQFSQPASKATSLPEFLLINSCDPANIFGAGAPQSIRHPENADWSFRRSQGNYLILKNGDPVIAIENRGQRLTPLMDLSSTDYQLALKKIPLLLRNPGIRSIKIETWNNAPVRNTFAATLLKELGFRDEFKQMILERSF
ncbi:hypothetical protein KAH55_09330 [bacterium]|nr:hypothetical protein [bacterium]